MLKSLAIILLLGMLLGFVFKKMHLPSLLGMLITGIILGPNALHLIDDSILSISSELRQLALIIILTRAGLSLNFKELKKIGVPAILMCFLPACFEMLGMLLIAPRLFGISMLDAAIMGSVIAAVSPAVIVPRMLRLIEDGYGTEKGIPQLILAGASVDDVFVIVVFTSLLAIAQGQQVSAAQFVQIPLSIVLGIVVGVVCGIALSKLFKLIHMRDSAKVLILLSVSFLLIALEDAAQPFLAFSGLLAVMATGVGLAQSYPVLAKRMSAKYSKLWVWAELMLFVLVGATVDLSYAVSYGMSAVLLLLLVLVFRMIGVYICLLHTRLTKKERLFCMIAYTPKATVQAAIGGIPLAMGLPCGNLVLTVAVLSIVITAPLGALGIDFSYKRLLSKKEPPLGS